MPLLLCYHSLMSVPGYMGSLLDTSNAPSKSLSIIGIVKQASRICCLFDPIVDGNSCFRVLQFSDHLQRAGGVV